MKKPFARETYNYALYGVLFGALFPIVATIVECLNAHGIVNFSTISKTQASEPLLWIIDTAPLILGMAFGLGGIRQDRAIYDAIKRKHAEGNIEIQSNKMKTIFDNAPYILMLVNDEGRVENINDKGVAFAGKEKADMLGRLGGEVFDCLNSFEGEGCGRNAECSQCPIRTKVVSTLKTGERHYEEEGKMVFFRDGIEIVRCFLISTALTEIEEKMMVLLSIADITERSRTEEEVKQKNRELMVVQKEQQVLLQSMEEQNRIIIDSEIEISQALERIAQSEEKYRGLFDNLTDVYYRTDHDGIITLVSPSVQKLLGYTPDEITGREITAFFVYPQQRADLIKDIIINGNTIDFESDFFRKDESIVAVATSARAIVDDNRNFLGMEGTIRDVTERREASQNMEESKKRLEAILNSVQAGVIIVNAETHVIDYVNPYASEIIGLNEESIFGKVCHKFICPASVGQCPVTDLCNTVDNSEKTLLTADGQQRDILQSIIPITLHDGKHLIETFVDITERKQSEQKLLLVKQAVESSNEAIAMTDAWGNHLFQNAAFTAMFGYEPEELLDRGGVLGILEDQVDVGEMFNMTVAGFRWSDETDITMKSGHKLPVLIHTSAVYDDIQNVIGIVGVFSNITKLKEMENQLRQHAITDELTGIYNRRHFYESLDNAIAATQDSVGVFSMVMIDLDGFKPYNDAFGHVSGDDALKEFAQTLKLAAGENTKVFRYGGDEFVAVFPSMNANDALEKILELHQNWAQLSQGKESLTLSPIGFSAGVGQFPDDADTIDGLMFLTDAALYHSKRNANSEPFLVSELGRDSSSKETELMDQVYALSSTIEAKDPVTHAHSVNVAMIASMIGEQIGLPNEQCEILYSAAILHDIGKVGLPDSILKKSGELTVEEWDIARGHCAKGASIVSNIKGLKDLVPAILYHHEKFDGSGYPAGLSREQIPLEARILCLADSYDTMTMERPYKEPMPLRVAMEEIRRCSGSHFDPALVRVFCDLMADTEFIEQIEDSMGLVKETGIKGWETESQKLIVD